MQYHSNKISGWGNYPMVESNVYEARNTKDIYQILASESNSIARGLGRSYGDQAVNFKSGVVVTTQLNHFISFDGQTGILECEAGVSISDIIEVFGPRNWFPPINPGTKHVTLGGAIANDVHGKAHHKDGSFSSCVISFRILLADGTIRSVSRQENPELFWANFGGLGLLGIILTVTIQLKRIQTTFFSQKAIKVECLEELLDKIEELDHEYDYSVAWINALAKGKSLGKGVFTVGNPASMDELPSKFQRDPLLIAAKAKIALPAYLPHFVLNNLSIGILNKGLEYVQSSNKSIVHYESFFFPLDIIDKWNRGYGKKGFIQYQFVIPMENGNKNIKKILEKISTSNHLPFLNVLKKFGEGQPQSFLSFPMKGYTFAIDFPFRDDLLKLTNELDAMVVDCGGRIYLGKDAVLNKNTFQAMYPFYKEWLKIKKAYDPENKFNSNIARRLGLLNETENNIQ